MTRVYQVQRFSPEGSWPRAQNFLSVVPPTMALTKANKNHHKERHVKVWKTSPAKQMQKRFSYTHTVHLEHPEVHGFRKIFQLVANKNPSSFEIPDCRNIIKTTYTLCPTCRKTACSTILSPSNSSKIWFVDVTRGVSVFLRRKSSQTRSSSWPTSVPPRNWSSFRMRAGWLSREA